MQQTTLKQPTVWEDQEDSQDDQYAFDDHLSNTVMNRKPINHPVTTIRRGKKQQSLSGNNGLDHTFSQKDNLEPSICLESIKTISDRHDAMESQNNDCDVVDGVSQMSKSFLDSQIENNSTLETGGQKRLA